MLSYEIKTTTTTKSFIYTENIILTAICTVIFQTNTPHLKMYFSDALAHWLGQEKKYYVGIFDFFRMLLLTPK